MNVAHNNPLAPAPSRVGRLLTVNGGSSSVKAAVFAPGEPPRRELSVLIERIGLPGTTLTAHAPEGAEIARQELEAPTHAEAARALIDFLSERLGADTIGGIGHRVVHGGLHLCEHQLVTDALVAELKKTQPLDLAHLPREIALIEAFRARLPRQAAGRLLRHGLPPRPAARGATPADPAPNISTPACAASGFMDYRSAYLMSELARDRPRRGARQGHPGASGLRREHGGRRDGQPVDTTMAFTPTAGLVMGTRPGDLDPGLLVYMMRVEKRTPDEMDRFISRRCGLLGVSGTSSDMRDLHRARRRDDPAAEDAVALFCYQARKWIGALAAAMGGLGHAGFRRRHRRALARGPRGDLRGACASSASSWTRRGTPAARRSSRATRPRVTVRVMRDRRGAGDRPRRLPARWTGAERDTFEARGQATHSGYEKGKLP